MLASHYTNVNLSLLRINLDADYGRRRCLKSISQNENAQTRIMHLLRRIEGKLVLRLRSSVLITSTSTTLVLLVPLAGIRATGTS